MYLAIKVVELLICSLENISSQFRSQLLKANSYVILASCKLYIDINCVDVRTEGRIIYTVSKRTKFTIKTVATKGEEADKPGSYHLSLAKIYAVAIKFVVKSNSVLPHFASYFSFNKLLKADEILNRPIRNIFYYWRRRNISAGTSMLPK